MRSAASTILGRHRWGRPGLVHVSSLVRVTYRGLFASWRTPGRHAQQRAPRATPARVPEPMPAI